MLALPLLLASLLAQAAAPAAPAPAAAVARPAVAASASAPDPSVPTPEGLEDLRRSFHDSCEVRVYGEYDDMCSALADEVRHYRAALDRAERRARSPR